MVDEATSTVQLDTQGRLNIPAAVRRALDIYDRKATLRLDIEVLDRDGEEK